MLVNGNATHFDATRKSRARKWENFRQHGGVGQPDDDVIAFPDFFSLPSFFLRDKTFLGVKWMKKVFSSFFWQQGENYLKGRKPQQ